MEKHRKQFAKTLVLAAALIAVLAPALLPMQFYAQTSPAWPPPFRFQSIYIDTPPDAQPIKVEILKKLRKWGEITVVYLPEQADLILQLDQSEKLNLGSGAGNRGSVVLKNRRTGEDLWSQSRGGAWSMRGWSNAAVGRKLGEDLIEFLSKNQIHIDKSK